MARLIVVVDVEETAHDAVAGGVFLLHSGLATDCLQVAQSALRAEPAVKGRPTLRLRHSDVPEGKDFIRDDLGTLVALCNLYRMKVVGEDVAPAVVEGLATLDFLPGVSLLEEGSLEGGYAVVGKVLPGNLFFG